MHCIGPSQYKELKTFVQVKMVCKGCVLTYAGTNVGELLMEKTFSETRFWWLD